jgi:hypothetical protein
MRVGDAERAKASDAVEMTDLLRSGKNIAARSPFMGIALKNRPLFIMQSRKLVVWTGLAAIPYAN